MGLTYVEGGGGRSARLHLTLSLVKKKKSNFLVMNKTFWYIFSSNIQ